MKWILLASALLFVSHGHASNIDRSDVWADNELVEPTDEFLPANIYQLDPRFTHHILVVEKSTHRLFLYENQNGLPKLLKTYQVASGKVTGDKAIEGDKKTPEGIYRFQKFHSNNELVKWYGEFGLTYGAGAFTTNYPNVVDLLKGKSGSGIWLHSTDDDSRVGKGLDSRGCVVAVDADLKDISRYIDLEHTPILIVQNMRFLKKSTWLKNRQALVDKFKAWAQAWESKAFETYIAQYSASDFRSRAHGNLGNYGRYKKAIFNRSEKPSIQFKNLSILTHEDYAVFTMLQNYSSELVQDTGKKTLYLTQTDNYDWKIVAELWDQAEPESEALAFSPSMRFFSNDAPSENRAVAKIPAASSQEE